MARVPFIITNVNEGKLFILVQWLTSKYYFYPGEAQLTQLHKTILNEPHVHERTGTVQNNGACAIVYVFPFA